MFCGAKYTHHTFTPIIKHLITTTAKKHPGKKVTQSISAHLPPYSLPPLAPQALLPTAHSLVITHAFRATTLISQDVATHLGTNVSCPASQQRCSRRTTCQQLSHTPAATAGSPVLGTSVWPRTASCSERVPLAGSSRLGPCLAGTGWKGMVIVISM